MATFNSLVLNISPDAEKYVDTIWDMIVQLFGPEQRKNPNLEYLTALKKISDMNPALHHREAGVDIEIPFRLSFMILIRSTICSVSSDESRRKAE